jgi:hypothetical protein
MDFNFADFDLPVVRKEICNHVAAEARTAVQLIPVTVAGASQDFEILNVIDVVECIDEKRSRFSKWTPADGRPEKTGQYRMFATIALDPGKADGHEIFRPKGWEVALVVEERIKKLLQLQKATGIVFQAIS